MMAPPPAGSPPDRCLACGRALYRPGAWHSCNDQDLSLVFTGRKAEMLDLFDSLLLPLSEWEGVEVHVAKATVLFTRKVAFLIVRPMIGQLDLKFDSLGPLADPNERVKDIYERGRTIVNTVRIMSPSEVDRELMGWIRAAYDLKARRARA